MSSPIYVGIDVSQKQVEVAVVGADGHLLQPAKPFANSLLGAEAIEIYLSQIAEKHEANSVQVATEATSFFDWHLLEFLASSERLATYGAKIYRLNPKWVKKFKSIASQTDKTDKNDAVYIAERLRFRTPSQPFNAKMNYIPLQRLTRFRFHLTQQIATEKNYFLSHLFLKFSSFNLVAPFSNTFGATSLAVIEDFSVDQLVSHSVEDLLGFVIEKGRNRFADPNAVVAKLKQVARESYRIRPTLAKSVDLVLATTLANIRALDQSLKHINDAISSAIAGFEITLQSIPGIGPVYAAGIFAEIGDISRFHKEEQLARYAGLAWRKTQSGDFEGDETPLMREANAYLRYYLVEAANSVRNHEQSYRTFYKKKYNEVSRHQHKRALVLTARKLVRLIWALLSRGEIYQRKKVKP